MKTIFFIVELLVFIYGFVRIFSNPLAGIILILIGLIGMMPYLEEMESK
jgi:hypothetical protein